MPAPVAGCGECVSDVDGVLGGGGCLQRGLVRATAGNAIKRGHCDRNAIQRGKVLVRGAAEAAEGHLATQRCKRGQQQAVDELAQHITGKE